MGTAALVSPDEVAKLIPAVVAQGNSLTIECADDYEMACSFLTLVASRKRQVEETFDPIVKKAHAAWKEAVAQRDKFMAPLLEAERGVKSKVSTWSMAEEKKRREDEQRLAKQAKDEADARALAEAEALAASGDTELADMVLEEAAAAPPPVVIAASTVPKQSGIATKTIYKWRFTKDGITSLRELVKAAAADDRYLPYLCTNETAIGATVRAQKELARIPGVQVYPETSVAVRSR
jgi:hypothetical protein